MPTHRSRLTLALLAGTALLTTACTIDPPAADAKRAPVVTYGAGEGLGSGGVHTVLRDENLWKVAQAYKLDLRDLIDANHLSPPYGIAEGQRLKLPPPRTYAVRNGDSVPSVARLFSVGQSEIVALNSLSSPYLLQTGQTLRLPQPRPVEREVITPPPAVLAALSAEPQAEITAQPIPPLVGSVPETQSVQTASLSMPSVIFPSAAPVLVAPPEKPAQMGNMSAPPPRTGDKFLLPVQGNLLSRFGPKSGGLYNEGVNIAAPAGTPVRAAENGVVVYVGDDLPGYGQMILVKHGDRFVTAYAHLGRPLVAKGQAVRRGQTIGTVGSSGNVDRAQLHFEVRQEGKALDPLTQT